MAKLQDEGKLDRVKGRIRSTWGSVTDNDVESARGDIEELIGKIKERTGESIESIRKRIDEMFDEDEGDSEHGRRGGTHY